MNHVDIHATERLRYPAPFAALSVNSRGRRYPLKRIPYRTDYQRDRDRIIHSTAFRRLQHKTQVFPNIGDEGDHTRTRLTHTIEVAQISRTIARMLGLNEDLAEAVALAHDLGHTPFGHAGEDVLTELTADTGGFNHNEQSLRVVDVLEKRYPDHDGLNLTYELREAIIKHETYDHISIPDEFHPGERPLLEGQIVNLADEIAYFGHDIDDGLATGLLRIEMIRSSELFIKGLDEIEASMDSPRMIRMALVRYLVNRMVIDLFEEIQKRIDSQNISSVADVRNCTKSLVSFSESQREFNGCLRLFLLEHMYRHPRLLPVREKAQNILSFLFRYFADDPERVPSDFISRYPGESRDRLIIDYIAGMSDRYAVAEFNRLS